MTAPRKTAATKKVAAKKTAAQPAKRKTTATTPARTTKKATPAKKATTRKTTKKAPATKAPRARGAVGSNERITWDELSVLGLLDSTHARAALSMAKWVDKADTPQGAAAAGRELRMQMHEARNAAKPLSPPLSGEEDEDDEDETPKDGPVSLSAMRARHAQRSS